MPRTSVFISYSHKDQRVCQELLTHLAPLSAQSRLSVWSDRDIETGQLWRAEIDRALSDARTAILLVSPNFLESRFVTEVEIPRLLQASQGDGLTVICIYIQHSVVGQLTFSGTRLTDFQGANAPERPLSDLSRAERTKALRDVAVSVITRSTPTVATPASTSQVSATPTSAPPVEKSPATPRQAAREHGMDSYEVIRRVAVSPNGEVFKCRAPLTRAVCIVKRTQSRKVSIPAQTALAAVRPPNVAVPTRIWVEDDFVYEELPYVGGTPLSQAVHRSVGGLRGALLEVFFSQMARILGALHAGNLIHRDIHPENIYLTLTPEDATGVDRLPSDWISDDIGVPADLRRQFGGGVANLPSGPAFHVAFVLVDCTFMTVNGERTTPVTRGAFTPIEQSLGSPSPASDYYALGATLYFLINGNELPAWTERGSDSVSLDWLDDRTGLRDFPGSVQSLLVRDATQRHLTVPHKHITLAGTDDCGTLELSDGTFLIASSSKFESRVVKQSEALRIHSDLLAHAIDWLASHAGDKASGSEYDRRNYQGMERERDEHEHWIRELSAPNR